MTEILPQDHETAVLIGRAWRPGIGPAVCTVRSGELIDITSKTAPTVRDLLEMDDPVAYARAAAGHRLSDIAEITVDEPAEETLRLLAPVDLQAIKACGVTFAKSMVERVIEERAAGDPTKADGIRARVTAIIGDSLSNLVPGSAAAEEVKAALIEEGMWSQYLEVGIGPYAEVFSKAQPMSSVGSGAAVGLHPISTWNNPEPEIVIVSDAKGRVRGATLGNDVNLRDVEGRSALLLSKAKDNNASTAIGPFIRLFDDSYSIDDVRAAELKMTVEGADGYVLHGTSSMREISRDPLDLAAQTCGRHHQYPDGFALFLGTLFAPTEDRDTPGMGFTHKMGDVVTIKEARLGSLRNIVRLSTECPPWSFGAGALMRNLSARNLV